MKSALISIQPKWCELIASGKKTVEVRKTKPKLETPFKVYIYCTQNNDGKIGHWLNLYCDSKLVTTDIHLEEPCYKLNGKVIGEFVCDEINTITKRGVGNCFDYCYLNLNEWGNDDIEIEILAIKNSCISKDELNLYGKNVYKLYAWHISNLVIYDKPRELSEFSSGSSRLEFSNTEDGFPLKWSGMKRPPQSWCYVEGSDNNAE